MLELHRPAVTSPTIPLARMRRSQDEPTTSPSASISELFPTGTATSAGNGTATGTGSGQQTSVGKSSTSLYLIVFLSILVVLLVTSLGVALRAIHLRRRFRSEIQRALARGSLAPWQADELVRAREADAWGLGRWSGWGAWDGAALDGVGMGRDGRRRARREKRRSGPRPVMWEVRAEEKGEDEGMWDAWRPFSVQAVSNGDATNPAPQPLLDIAESSALAGASSSRAMPGLSQRERDAALAVESIFNPASSTSTPNTTQPYHLTARRISRPSDDEAFVVPGGGRGMPRRRSRSRSADRGALAPDAAHPERERERSRSRPPGLDTVRAGFDSGQDSSAPTPRAPQSPRSPLAPLEGVSTGQMLRAGFMIRMPERPGAREGRARRAARDEDDEGEAHPPMEIGIWTGRVEDVRFEDAEEDAGPASYNAQGEEDADMGRSSMA